MNTILVTGTNRGIGLEFVSQFLRQGNNVIATCRKKSTCKQLMNLKKKFASQLEILELDLLSDISIDSLGIAIGSKSIDIFVSNAGVMGTKNNELENLNAKEWLEVFRINTVGPILLTKRIMNNILAGHEKKIVYISSRVGSISENRNGALYAYRSSKAALNQSVKSLSINLRELGITAIALHPGWVKTKMGGENALIDAETSVSGMISIIENSSLKDTGTFINFDGKSISW